MHNLNIDSWFVGKAEQVRDGRLNACDKLDARETSSRLTIWSQN